LNSTAMLAVLASASRNSLSRCKSSARLRMVTPLALPPGLWKPATKPMRTGSPPIKNMIGIVDVAALAAMTAARPLAPMTATPRVDQFGGQRGQFIIAAPRPTIGDSAVPAVAKSCFIQAQQKCIDVRRKQLGRPAVEKSDDRRRLLLCARSTGPCCRAGEQ